MDEIRTRQKKELKSLEGEKRASVKKAKSLKGKKGKEALARYGLCMLDCFMSFLNLISMSIEVLKKSLKKSLSYYKRNMKTKFRKMEVM